MQYWVQIILKCIYLYIYFFYHSWIYMDKEGLVKVTIAIAFHPLRNPALNFSTALSLTCPPCSRTWWWCLRPDILYKPLGLPQSSCIYTMIQLHTGGHQQSPDDFCGQLVALGGEEGSIFHMLSFWAFLHNHVMLCVSHEMALNNKTKHEFRITMGATNDYLSQ